MDLTVRIVSITEGKLDESALRVTQLQQLLRSRRDGCYSASSLNLVSFILIFCRPYYRKHELNCRLDSTGSGQGPAVALVSTAMNLPSVMKDM